VISLNTPADALQQIASFIKKTRLQSNITMQDLAQRSGIGIATLARVEKNGTCSTEILVRIFAALGFLDGFIASLAPPNTTSIAELRRLSQKAQRQRARSKP